MPSLLNVSALNVGGSNIKQFSVAMEMLQWVLFALLLNHKIFLTAVNTTKLLFT
jgi:hypothetical protein